MARVLLTLGFGVAGIALAAVAMPADVRRKTHPALIAAAVVLSLGAAALCGRIGGETADAAFAAAIIPLFFAISAVDLATRRIPNRALLVGTAAVLGAALWSPSESYVFSVLGGVAGLAFGIIAFVAGGGRALGAGDAKLVAFIGAAVGLRLVLPAITYGTLLGGLAAVVVLLARRRNAAFAYGPYLSLGAIITLLLSLR